jgi:lipoprotein signal peptidase
VLVVDQASKAWARASLPSGQDVTAIPGWLWFRFLSNTGATLGLLGGHNQLVAVLSLLIVAALAVVALRAQAGGTVGAFALGAIVGGALGNLVDRVRLGAVTDFIEVRVWPTDFNLADAAIRLGVALFLIALLIEVARGRPSSSRR